MGGSDIVTGTLELLVLKTLADGRRHGYAIGRTIREQSADVLRVGENVLYPALHRLEARGDVRADWGTTETGREARFYRLTAKGRTRLRREAERWIARSEAARAILEGNGVA
jgi:PadR family transcriptional regulator